MFHSHLQVTEISDSNNLFVLHKPQRDKRTDIRVQSRQGLTWGRRKNRALHKSIHWACCDFGLWSGEMVEQTANETSNRKNNNDTHKRTNGESNETRKTVMKWVRWTNERTLARTTAFFAFSLDNVRATINLRMAGTNIFRRYLYVSWPKLCNKEPSQKVNYKWTTTAGAKAKRKAHRERWQRIHTHTRIPSMHQVRINDGRPPISTEK